MHLGWRGLSSGEQARLNFQSRLYERLYNTQKTFWDKFEVNKSLILLIDEGGSFYHPEWQRTYIYDLIKFLKEIKLKSNIENIQVILTTHSPFVLSDLARDHIIYLTKYNKEASNYNYCQVLKSDEKPLSFAGNINNLLRHSFFLKDSLVGKYAEKKIEEMLTIYKEGNKNSTYTKAEIEYLINEISEPILRGHIESLTKDFE